MAYDRNSKPVQFLPNWPNAHVPKTTPAESTTAPSVHEEALDHVTLNELQQGELYILKIKLIVVALFQGWDDDMCCFSVLRTDLLDELRWSEARYLPNNFDAYLAFDYAGNPPIHLWTKQLRDMVPVNWFNMFEEARHMQRQWNISYWNPEPNATVMMIEDDHHQQQDAPVNVNDDYLEPSQDQHQFDGDDEQSSTTEAVDDNTAPQEAITTITATTTTTTTSPKSDLFLSELPTNLDPSLAHPIVAKTNSTPAMRLQNQYIRSTLDVPQPQKQQGTIEEKQLLPAVTKPQTKSSKSEGTTIQRTKSTSPATAAATSTTTKRPEVKQRRSFSSFFLKKKKSKKSLNEEKSTKRKSTPPDAPPLSRSATSDPNKKPSAIDIPSRRKSESNAKKNNKNTEVEALENLESSNSDTSEKPASSLSSPTIKTPKNDAMDSSATNKVELFDMESYFDMQATFAFLNNTNIDNFSLVDIPSGAATTKSTAQA